jgi:sugar phosphate isomerase/epimerase
MQVQLSLAAFPGLTFGEALHVAHATPLSEPAFGAIGVEHVQLCPQNRGILDEAEVDALREAFPNCRLRAHANVRVLPARQVIDLDRFNANDPYWQTLARISRRLDAPVYTAHAGQRKHATLDQAFENTRRAADLFGVPVGIEGHYPTPRDLFLLSTWEDYARLLTERVGFVLDLSHLHIVATQTGRYETNLLAELLDSPDLLEVHLSANEGAADEHAVLTERPWWWPVFEAAHLPTSCTVFTEGNHRRAA